jgi:hypothetical protein
MHGADDRDVDRQGPWRAREVPPHDPELRFARHAADAVGDRIDVLDGRVGRQHQREESVPRRGPHGRDVADVDGEGAIARVGKRREAPVEMDPFDKGIGRQHMQRVSLGCHDRGVVANSEDESGGGRWQQGTEALDEPAFAEVRE